MLQHTTEDGVRFTVYNLEAVIDTLVENAQLIWRLAGCPGQDELHTRAYEEIEPLASAAHEVAPDGEKYDAYRDVISVMEVTV